MNHYGMSALSDEDKKIAWKSHHENFLKRVFLWDKNSFSERFSHRYTQLDRKGKSAGKASRTSSITVLKTRSQQKGMPIALEVSTIFIGCSVGDQHYFRRVQRCRLALFSQAVALESSTIFIGCSVGGQHYFDRLQRWRLALF